MKSKLDFSTINIEALKRLKVYTLPPTYRLQDGSGSGCSGDAPGFPSYFTRSIYTRHGNNPRKGAEEVILHEGKMYVTKSSDDWRKGDDWDAVYARYQERLMRLWVAPPIDSPRVRAWIESTYRHFNHCYVDVERPKYGKPGTLIYPVPAYRLKDETRQEYIGSGLTPQPDYMPPKYSQEYLDTVNTAVRIFNADERARAKSVAIPENHHAVRIIRKFYPEYQPEPALINDVSGVVTAQWWETEAEQPTPETCRPRSCGPHPVNGQWCQRCGWKAEVT